jgi:hypothetical protein
MMKYGVAKVIKVVLTVIVAFFVFGFVTMHLWNWLMPMIFGLTPITFWQALGLVLLSKILFGGFHRHGGGGRAGWRRKMENRWAQMSPEERERMRAGMRGWRCGVPPTGKPHVEEGSI